MKFDVIIKGDHNDADYAYTTNVMSADQVERLASIIKRLQRFKGNSKWSIDWEISYWGANKPENKYGDLLTGDEYDWMNDIVPRGPDEAGLHTINSITVYPTEGRRVL